MPTTKEVLSALLSKTLNWNEDKVASLFANEDGSEFKPDALQSILDADAARVKTFKDENTAFFDKGHQKATAEALAKHEKAIKEKFGIKTDKEGLELIDAIVTASKGKDSGLEEDKVKTHPVYIAKVDELEGKLKETATTWETKYNERESSIKKENTFRKIQKKADEILAELKPILPSDAAKAAKQKAFLLQELQAFEYDEQGDEIIIKKEGKLFEDAHGSRVKIDALVKQKAGEIWDFQQGTGRSNAGNKTGQEGAAGGGANVKAPKNKDEYSKMIAEAKTPEDRIAISDAWKVAQKASAEE